MLIRGEEGHDIVPELYPLENEPIIDKPGRGAFAHTDFDLLLRINGIKNLVIAGVTTDVCVSSTMREANDRGYDCMLVEDGTTATEPVLHHGAIESVKMEGGIFGVVGQLEDVVLAVEACKNASIKSAARNTHAATPNDQRSPETPGPMIAHSMSTPMGSTLNSAPMTMATPLSTPISMGAGDHRLSMSAGSINGNPYMTDGPGMGAGDAMGHGIGGPQSV